MVRRGCAHASLEQAGYPDSQPYDAGRIPPPPARAGRGKPFSSSGYLYAYHRDRRPGAYSGRRPGRSGRPGGNHADRFGPDFGPSGRRSDSGRQGAQGQRIHPQKPAVKPYRPMHVLCRLHRHAGHDLCPGHAPTGYGFRSQNLDRGGFRSRCGRDRCAALRIAVSPGPSTGSLWARSGSIPSPPACRPGISSPRS